MIGNQIFVLALVVSFFVFFTSSSEERGVFFLFFFSSGLMFPFGAGLCTAGLADVGAKNRLISCTHTHTHGRVPTSTVVLIQNKFHFLTRKMPENVHDLSVTR